jgi:hypothetical protein
MDPQDEKGTGAPSWRRTRNRALGGVVLILIGVIALIETLVPQSDLLGLLFLPALGLIFLIWGIAAREPGPLVPGGILTGLGVGVLLAQQGVVHPVVGGSVDDTSGAVVLISMGVGFLIITPLSAVFTTRRQSWPLIPGGILVAIGVILFIGGPLLATLNVVRFLWPLALIALGVWVLWRASQRRHT